MKKILVIGSLNLDIVARVGHMPEIGETILSDDMEMIPGGKGANQACAAGKLGARVCMLGALGKDAYGNILLESLQNAGVDTSRLIRRERESTGLALINVNAEGNNSIVVIPGANQTVDKNYIDENEEAIKESDIIILQMEIPIATVLYAAQKAKKWGKTVILDPAPVPEYFPQELFQYVDIIKPNETELQMIAKAGGESLELEWAAEYLRQKGVKDVIVTLGEKGVYVNSERKGILQIPAQKVEAVDTTAAGDTFTAAMAVKLAEEADIEQAVEFANRASAIAVTRKGAQASIPTREEVCMGM